MTDLLVDRPPSPALATLILAHGAGAGMESGALASAAAAVAAAGIAVVRFEFAYMTAGRLGTRKPPPRLPALVPEYADVLARVLADTHGPVLLGGKSMGSRVACRLAGTALDRRVAGVVAWGFPFHRPGAPQATRLGDLAASRLPVLVCQGTRDPFGTRAEVDGYALPPTVRVAWFEDGDHDLAPRKASGFTAAGHAAAAAAAIAAFAASPSGLGGEAPGPRGPGESHS